MTKLENGDEIEVGDIKYRVILEQLYRVDPGGPPKPLQAISVRPALPRAAIEEALHEDR